MMKYHFIPPENDCYGEKFSQYLLDRMGSNIFVCQRNYLYIVG